MVFTITLNLSRINFHDFSEKSYFNLTKLKTFINEIKYVSGNEFYNISLVLV